MDNEQEQQALNKDETTTVLPTPLTSPVTPNVNIVQPIKKKHTALIVSGIIVGVNVIGWACLFLMARSILYGGFESESIGRTKDNMETVTAKLGKMVDENCHTFTKFGEISYDSAYKELPSKYIKGSCDDRYLVFRGERRSNMLVEVTRYSIREYIFDQNDIIKKYFTDVATRFMHSKSEPSQRAVVSTSNILVYGQNKSYVCTRKDDLVAMTTELRADVLKKYPDYDDVSVRVYMYFTTREDIGVDNYKHFTLLMDPRDDDFKEWVSDGDRVSLQVDKYDDIVLVVDSKLKQYCNK